MADVTIQTQTTVSASGQGALGPSLAELKAFVAKAEAAGLPPHTSTHVQSYDSQRDGSSWKITAQVQG